MVQEVYNMCVTGALLM